MKSHLLPVLVLLIPLAVGFDFPQEKKVFIGNWDGYGYSLRVAPDGSVNSIKVHGGVRKEITGKIRVFKGNDFVVSVLAVPVTFKVQKPPYREGPVWKMTVDGIDVFRLADASSDQIPKKEILEKLISDSVYTFAQSVRQRDFNIFYKTISRFWQVQTTPLELQKTFTVFIDKKIDLTSLKTQTPILNQTPMIDAQGFLVLKGSYPQQEGTVLYQLTYFYEHPAWKLSGLEIEM